MIDETEDSRRKYLQGYPINLTVAQKFRILLVRLRKEFPPEHPVRVRRLNKDMLGPDAPFGVCGLSNQYKPKSQRYFLIWIRNSDSWNVQSDTLIHEWAHTLTWFQLPNGKDHGDLFARKYGVLYRAYIED